MADLKVLRVCLSKDLPSSKDRLSNYIYFTYDSLSIYPGSNDAISNDFAIVDNMPENPVPKMLYILSTDGSLHQYIDYIDTTIAEIEDASQIELIGKAGTTFFVNGDSKYIDKQSRVLVLPFNNGTYELAVNSEVEQKFDNDTIIKYNEESGRFEIYGGTEDYKDYSHFLKGKDTDSVSTKVNGSRIDARVILSKALDNALKIVSDGLYVRSDNKVNKEDYEAFVKDVKDLKSYTYAILDNLDAEIAYIESIISEESISAEIMSQLRAEYDDIDVALENYDEIRDSLDTIESESMAYASTILNTGIEDIDSKLETSSSWKDLSEDVSDYTHEVNYYDKAEAYNNELSDEEVETILGAAVAGFLGIV